MKKMLFLFLFLICLSQNIKAQTYSFKYIITTDTAFVHYKEGLMPGENDFQSFIRQSFFDSTIISCHATKELILQEVTPKFLQKNKVNPGYRIGDSQGGITLDSAAFDNKDVIDKRNRILYRIKPYPHFVITCQNEDNSNKFKKCKETKQIGVWKCEKWTPLDKSIKDEVVIWVCKDIPDEICFDLIGDQLSGGIVQIDFARGFSYKLMDYRLEADPSFKFPEIGKCETSLGGKVNFIKDTWRDKIALDSRYEFKTKDK